MIADTFAKSTLEFMGRRMYPAVKPYCHQLRSGEYHDQEIPKSKTSILSKRAV